MLEKHSTKLLLIPKIIKKWYINDKIKFIYFNQNKYNSDTINIDKFNYTHLENITNDIKNYTKKNIIVNGTINNKDIWKKLYDLDCDDMITKIGLVKIKKNEYTYVVY